MPNGNDTSYTAIRIEPSILSQQLQAIEPEPQIKDLPATIGELSAERSARISELKKAWKKQIREQRKQIQNEWKEDYKSRFDEYPDDIPDSLFRIFAQENAKKRYEGRAQWRVEDEEDLRSKRFTGRQAAQFKRMRQIRDFIDYYDRKNRERFEKLSPENKDVEMQLGGVYDENLLLNSVAAGAIDKATGGLYRVNHALYGERFKKQHQDAYGWGEVIGQLAMFSALSKVAGATKLTAAIASGMQKTKAGRAALYALGVPKAAADRIPVIRTAARFLGMKYGDPTKVPFLMAAQRAGAEGLIVGAIGSIMETVQNLTDKYEREDQMSERDWRKQLNAGKIVPLSILKGFMEKYFISLINDPRSWPMRIVGDALYSTAEMGADVLAGQREWNKADLARNFVLGHVMGEVQGKVFGANRKAMQAYRSSEALRHNAEYAVREGLARSVDDPIAMRFAHDMAFSTMHHMAKYGRLPTDEAISRARAGLKNIMMSDMEIYKSSEFPQIFSIDRQFLNRPAGGNIDSAYQALRDTLDLDRSSVEFLRKNNLIENKDFNTLYTAMRDLDRISKGKPQPRTEEEAYNAIAERTYGDFIDSINERMVKKFPKAYEGITDKKGQVNKTIDLLRPVSEEGVPETQAGKITPDDIDVRQSRVTDFLESKPNKLSNREKLIRSLRSFDKPDYTSADALSDFYVRMLDGDSKFFTTSKGEDWTASTEQMYKYIKRVLRNALIDRGKRTREGTTADDIVKIADEEYAKGALSKQFKREVDSGEYSAAGSRKKMYNVLMHMARGTGRQPVVRTAALYLKSAGLNSKQISDRLREFGIRIGPKQVQAMLVSAQADFSALALSGKIDDNFDVKQTFTRKKLQQAFDEVVRESAKYNEVTGLRQDINDPDFIKLSEQNGMYVIDIGDTYRRIFTAYSKDMANNATKATAKLIDDAVDEINAHYINRRDTEMYIKNPEELNSTQFILYQRGMTDNEFKANASYIHNILRKNHPDNQKKFAIILENADGTKESIENIPNNMMYSKKSEVNEVDPDTTLPPWKEAQIAEEGKLPEDTSDIRVEQDENLKARVNDKEEQAYAQDYAADDINQVDEIISAMNSSGGGLAAWSERFKEKVTGVKKFYGELQDAINRNFTIWEGLDRQEGALPMIQALTQFANMPYEQSRYAANLVRNTFMPVMNRIEDKAVRDKVGYIAGWAFESEFGRVIDKDNFSTKASDAELKSPIKMGKGKTLNLESFRNKRHLTPEDMFIIRETATDPLEFTKLFYQLYGIEPEVTRDMFRAYGKMRNALVNEYKAGNYVTMADVEKEMFDRMREELRKAIAIVIERSPEIPLDIRQRIENADMYHPDARAALDRIANYVTDPQMKAKLQRSIKQYFELDPESVVYMPHTILGDKAKNERVFKGEIYNYIEGRPTRGQSALDTVKREAQKRAFGTRAQAMDAGLELRDINIFEELTAEIAYLRKKNMNRLFLDKLKTTFMNKVITANDRGYLSEFLEEHTAYFYYPSIAEMKKYEGYISLIDKKIEQIQSMPQNTETQKFITDLLKNKAILSERIAKMEMTAQILQSETAREGAQLLTLGDVFLPMNMEDFHATVGMPVELKSSIKKSAYKNRLRASNVKGAEGLYFHRVPYKAINEMIYGGNYYDVGQDSFGKKMLRKLAKLNSGLKQLAFDKPQIIMANDLQQMAIVDPRSLKNIPLALQAVNDFRDNKDTWGAQFVKRMERGNMFNRSTSPYQYLTDGYKAMAEIMNKNAYLGKTVDNITDEKNYIMKVFQAGKGAFKSQQEFAWYMDEVLRTALAMQMNERFRIAYGDKIGDYITAEYVNKFMGAYSRLPSATRRMLNLIFFVPTYRVHTLRMYKDMIKSIGRVARGQITGDYTPEFKVNERQKLFELKPIINTILLKGMTKGLLYSMFGLGYDSVWDFLTGYRAKREKGDRTFDKEVQFFSLGGPLWDIEKHLTRLSRNPQVWFRYNIAAFPGLMWSLAANRHPITNEKIITAGPTEPHKAFAQLGMHMIREYVPIFGEPFKLLTQERENMLNIINHTGLGNYYKSKSPKELLHLFEKAVDESKSDKERIQAQRDFKRALDRAYYTLFKKQYKSWSDQLEEQIKGERQ